MKIVIAHDSFKGCLSSAEEAAAISLGVKDVCPTAEVVEVTVADGGEGTVQVLCQKSPAGSSSRQSGAASIVSAPVSDPLGRRIRAEYGIIGRTAIIESAAACGLTLLSPGERNPVKATTRGLGEMILDAIGRGCTEFLIGLGGSATNDGGRGMVETPGLLEAARGLKFTIACDVDTPFIGPQGASRVFGPQKGASVQDVEILEERLREYSAKIQEDTGIDVRNMKGAGAAGGLGGAFKAYLGAELRRGVDMILDFIGFDRIISGASLVITGEGCSDFQTPKGKTPAGVLERAGKQGIPSVLLSGAVKRCSELDAMGFVEIRAATPPDMPLSRALEPATASHNLRKATNEIIKRVIPNMI